MFDLGSLIGRAAGSFIDKALGPVKEIALAWVNKEISEAEFDSRIKIALMDVFKVSLQEQSSVIQAEINAEDWITRTWRPIVALTSFFSLWYVIFVIPHLVHVGWLNKSPSFGEVGLGWFFTITGGALGGYIVGRSGEKIAQTIMGVKR